MKQITMPRLSDTMEEGAISTWHKNVGDRVEAGDLLAEIETDKATMDFEAYESGVLTAILVPEGETAAIGTLIAELDGAPGGSGDGGATQIPTPEEAASVAVKTVNAETPSQAPVAAGAPDDGTSFTEAVPASAPAPAAASMAAELPTPGASAAQPPERLLASPLVRTIAREHGIDLRTVTGSGPGGRIIRADVDDLSGARAPGLPTAQVATAQPSPSPAQRVVPGVVPSAALPTPSAPSSLDERRGTEQMPMDSVRRLIAQRLAESARSTPHFAVTSAADAEALIAMRATLNERLVAASRQKVSLNDLLVRAAALALREHPLVNASYPGDDSRVMQVHHRINIGIAVASAHGLVVPVIDDADTKSVGRLAEESKRLVTLAQDRKLTPDQMSGGTFTISNLGMYGVEEFTAIINPPEGAILAVGGTKVEPAVVDGDIVPRHRLRYTLISDHRIIDGALAAQWLQTFTRLIEDPWTILA